MAFDALPVTERLGGASFEPAYFAALREIRDRLGGASFEPESFAALREIRDRLGGASFAALAELADRLVGASLAALSERALPLLGSRSPLRPGSRSADPCPFLKILKKPAPPSTRSSQSQNRK
ncbi:MAG: hypothetical protein ABR972_05550 [Acidimicrobiales bacterium]|jgi:hypothetical protein